MGVQLDNFAQSKGFDGDHHLTNEVEKSLKDGQINSKEAQFMVKVMEEYGRKNIRIKKEQLTKLGKEFGLNYSHLSKIGPKLEQLINERANTIENAKKGQLEIKQEVEKKSPFDSYITKFKKYKGQKIKKYRDLQQVLNKEGITVLQIQKALFDNKKEWDGKIGIKTFTRFKNSILQEEALQGNSTAARNLQNDQLKNIEAKNASHTLKILKSHGIKVKSSGMGYNENGISRASHRTGLVGLKNKTLQGALILKKLAGGDITITGGTEKGHSTRFQYNHFNGYKLDFRTTEQLLSFIKKTTGKNPLPSYKSLHAKVEGINMKFYIENDHIDVAFT